jgi:two-component system chemotaxis response regulator CheY
VITRRILVVDDDAAILTFISMALSDEGYEVLTAEDGLSALELVLAQHPDLILLDMRMPGLDGRAFIQTYKEKPDADIPIILMTADHSDRNALADLPIEGYLAKPFDLDDLLNLVNQHVSHRNNT